jgi:hypothetical protein
MGWEFIYKMKKLTIEYIKEQFAKENYVLLTKEYINNEQKLDYVCSNNHRHNISWNKWQQNRRCPFCKKHKIGSNIKLNFAYIKKEFKSKGYKLLSKKYIGAHYPLYCECPNRHRFFITWANFKHNKRGCPKCYYIRESIERISEGNPNWNNGSSFEPYCPVWLDKEFKKSILERDNYQCQNPDCWGTGSKLTGHHIDYNKKNCDPFNIITVCNSCNGRANKDRDYWTKFYREIMNKKYGYKYGENNEEKVISMSR